MNLYTPLAIQQPGAISKQGYQGRTTNSVRGVVCHSMEGYAEAALAEVKDASMPLSWHFSVLEDGTVWQHYPLNAICWHGGNQPINESLIGIEHEGVKGVPLTDVQLASSIALVDWIAGQGGWTPQRHVTLFEHNEVVTLYTPNAGPTACPNGRIPWEQYVEDEMQTIPVVNADFMALLQKEVEGGVTVGQNVANPKEYLVRLP